MSSLVKTLNVFPRERTIVTRERAKKAYHILPYFGSKYAQYCALSGLRIHALIAGTLPCCRTSTAGCNHFRDCRQTEALIIWRINH